MSALIAPAAWIMAGSLKELSLRHMATRRHRAAAFLLIVALLASLAIYPTVMTAVFDNKTERGARVQLGGDMQVTLNALDLMPPEAQARGGLKARVGVLDQRMKPLVERLQRLPEVRRVSVMIEGLVEGLFMPDRGFSGLPLYVIADAKRHLASVYSEPELGSGNSFASLMERLAGQQVLTSTAVSSFYRKAAGQPMPVGRTTDGKLERASFGGAVHFLPGVPLRTVNEREGDRKSTRLNSSHIQKSRMPSSA